MMGCRAVVSVLILMVGLAACDRSNPQRDLVVLSEEDAAYQPLPPLRDPVPGAPLPEPGWQ